MSSGSVINLTAGILFRMRNTSCWTVRMNILSAFALSTSLSSHLSMGSFGSGWRHLQLSHAGAIYNWHTLEPFQELGLDSQIVKKLASKLHVHSVNYAAKLVHTRRALSSTIINSHQETISGQACNPPDPH